jgi:hypothetical protein
MNFDRSALITSLLHFNASSPVLIIFHVLMWWAEIKRILKRFQNGPADHAKKFKNGKKRNLVTATVLTLKV